MKKLLSFLLVGAISAMSLTSCQDENSSIPEKQTIEKSVKVSEKNNVSTKMSEEEQLIYNDLVEITQNYMNDVKYEYSGRYKLICHTQWLSSWGNACYETPLGNYNIHWQPLHYNEMPQMPASSEFNPIMFSGSWGCRC